MRNEISVWQTYEFYKSIYRGQAERGEITWDEYDKKIKELCDRLHI